MSDYARPPDLPIDAPQPKMIFAAAGVILASIGFGLVPLFARGLIDQGMAPHAIAFYRYILTGMILLPLLWPVRRHVGPILWGLFAGLVMGLGWIGYVRAVAVAPVSVVGVLYMTYPVFTVMIAWLLFRDRPTGRAVLAALLIVAAAALASSPAAVSPAHLPALLLSLAAPLGFGLGISVLVHRLTVLPPLARVAAVSLGAVIGLAPLVVATPMAQVLPAAPSQWGLILGIAIVTALVPQLIYTSCAPRVGANRTAVFGSVELPTMFFIGLLAFGETLSWLQLFACALVVFAIILSGWERRGRLVTQT